MTRLPSTSPCDKADLASASQRSRRQPLQSPPSHSAFERLSLRNQRVEEHQQLVRPLAIHYARRCGESWEDLLQVGLLGLIRASELYRPESGTPFAAFARPHIRGAILHYLRDVAPAVRLPRRAAELQERLHRLSEEAVVSSGGPGETSELRQRLGLKPDQWALVMQQRRLSRPLPLEASQVESLESPEPEELVDHLESIRTLMDRLDPRLKHVVRRVVLDGSSYRQLAMEMQVSASTVQRLLQRGLDTLKEQAARPGLRNPRELRLGRSGPRVC